MEVEPSDPTPPATDSVPASEEQSLPVKSDGSQQQQGRGTRRRREAEDAADEASPENHSSSIAALGQEIANEMAAAAAISPPLAVQDVALPAPVPLQAAPTHGKGSGRGRKRQNLGELGVAPGALATGTWSATAAASAPPKSELTLLCERFQRRYGRLAPDGSPRVLLLNDVAASLEVPRRRLYDVINVFEAIEAMRRVGKLTYEFVGFAHLPALLAQLLDEELKGLPVDDRPRRAAPAGGAAASGQTEEAAASAGSQQKPSSHSLWVLSRRLVRMLLNHSGPITLAAAAAILVGPPPPAAEGAAPRSQTQITVERRLYDISSILCSIGLIQRVYVKKRQPAFEWIYGWRPGDTHPPPPLLPPGEPEPEGADLAAPTLPMLPPPALAYPPPLTGLLPTLGVPPPPRPGSSDLLLPGQAEGDAAAAAMQAMQAMQAMHARAHQVLQLQHLQATLSSAPAAAGDASETATGLPKPGDATFGGLVPAGVEGAPGEGTPEAQAAAAAAAAQAAINAAMMNPGAFMASPGDGTGAGAGAGDGTVPANNDAAAASLAAAANASLLMWAPHLFFAPGMFGMGFPGVPPGATNPPAEPGTTPEGGEAGAVAPGEGAAGVQGAEGAASANPVALPLTLPPGYQFSPFGPGGLLPMVPPLMLPPAPALIGQKGGAQKSEGEEVVEPGAEGTASEHQESAQTLPTAS